MHARALLAVTSLCDPCLAKAAGGERMDFQGTVGYAAKVIRGPVG